MRVQSMHFQARAGEKLADTRLQRNLKKLAEKFVSARATVMQEIDFTATRQAAVERRNRVLERLDSWIELFERNAQARGATVLFAETPAEASELVVRIAKHHQVKLVTKSKSMVSEEMEMNHYLGDRGIDCLESDMGEFIVQLREEKPSHIIMPAIHLNAGQVAKLFHDRLEVEYTEDVDRLIQIGRETLRRNFFEADIGVSGVNFAIAETGTLLLVENEGNGRMSTTVPQVHIAVTGIEKVVENLRDVIPLLSLLTRSATGQAITTYVNMISSPRKPDELDGPREVHLVLLDNGRSQAFADGELRQTLNCIRCGACMNHCPVYTRIGGHAYGTVYPGPIGKIVTPHMLGLEATRDLPTASSMCGACGEVCPVKIPIPSLLRRLREEAVRAPTAEPHHVRGQGAKYSKKETLIWKAWRTLNTSPALYRAAMYAGTRLRGLMPADIGPWTEHRSAPKPAARSLHELAREHLGKD